MAENSCPHFSTAPLYIAFLELIKTVEA